MAAERKAPEDNGTWVIIDLPPNKRVVGCKWVFKTKYKSDGTIERHKARLVAKGFTQTEGLDYTRTYSPVSKLTTLRCLLAVAATQNWHLFQLDVNKAMSPYQIPLRPQTGLSELQSQADYSPFTQRRGTSYTTVLVYVNDILLAGNGIAAIDAIKAYLHSQFHLKDFGVLKYLFGLEVALSPSGIFLSQRKYALDIVHDYGLTNAKPTAFPMDQNSRFDDTQGELLVDATHYRRLLGCLQYLTVTRPDILYAVDTLSQFSRKPKKVHWDAALRILRYIKATPGHGILLSSTSSL
ncbi:PREDICTED: uncharacterized protein LOC109115091 [Nelumbo nucifera]|uniref:Uncharacterized protein LOC109115091 n=1 Tax=Nelumbo nucifera TaxID=4432 RepID=A0A1U8Q8A5_NELNU|nr:PREDICTED: uncharacterized protein LOC109115091 [Nelumbo nucifera]